MERFQNASNAGLLMPRIEGGSIIRLKCHLPSSGKEIAILGVKFQELSSMTNTKGNSLCKIPVILIPPAYPSEKEGIPLLLFSLLFSCSLVTLTGELALRRYLLYQSSHQDMAMTGKEENPAGTRRPHFKILNTNFWWRLCGYCIEEEEMLMIFPAFKVWLFSDCRLIYGYWL